MEKADEKVNILQKINCKLKNAGIDFHIYNYILPAILPIVGLFICLSPNFKIINWKNIYLSSLSQLLYFSFFILISNMVLLYSKDRSRTCGVHLVAAVIILFVYICFSINLYSEFHVFGYIEIPLWTIAVGIILYLVIGVYAMNPEAPYNENEITTEISVNKENQENKTDEELN